MGKDRCIRLFLGMLLCVGISSSNSQSLDFPYSHSRYRVSLSDVPVVLFRECINVSSAEKLCLVTGKNRTTIDGVKVINWEIAGLCFLKRYETD